MDLWGTKFLDLESFSDRGLFLILHRADSLALVNRSEFSLRDCSLIRYGVTTRVGDMPAGQELRLNPESKQADVGAAPHLGYGLGILSPTVGVYQTEIYGGAMGDCVVCGMGGLIPSLASEDGKVIHEGSTAVVFHLGRPSAGGNDPDRR